MERRNKMYEYVNVDKIFTYNKNLHTREWIECCAPSNLVSALFLSFAILSPLI